MHLIDDRGRLLGVVNLVDAIVGGVLIGLVPLGFGAYLLFRPPTPVVQAVEPAQYKAHRPTTLHVTGTNLRPYLRARFGSVDAPGFLVASPTAADVRLPDLPPGTYDLVLLDEGRELVRKPAAISLVDSTGLTGEATAMLRVLFTAWPSAVEHAKAGDADVGNQIAVPGEPSAVLQSVGEVKRAEGRVGAVPTPQLLAMFEGHVRVPVTAVNGSWQYGKRPVKIGSSFAFETAVYRLDGHVLDMSITPDSAQ